MRWVGTVTELDEMRNFDFKTSKKKTWTTWMEE
jgi:hypothetical protein